MQYKWPIMFPTVKPPEEVIKKKREMQVNLQLQIVFLEFRWSWGAKFRLGKWPFNELLHDFCPHKETPQDITAATHFYNTTLL